MLILVEWSLVPWLTPHVLGASHAIHEIIAMLHVAFTISLYRLHSRASLVCLMSPSTSTSGGVSSSPRLDFSQGP